jgi:hypothetical protein
LRASGTFAISSDPRRDIRPDVLCGPSVTKSRWRDEWARELCLERPLEPCREDEARASSERFFSASEGVRPKACPKRSRREGLEVGAETPLPMPGTLGVGFFDEEPWWLWWDERLGIVWLVLGSGSPRRNVRYEMTIWEEMPDTQMYTRDREC